MGSVNATLWSALPVLVLGLITAEVRAGDQCLTCHRSMGDKPSTLFLGDIHRKSGLTCAGCHGGDDTAAEAERAMDSAKGFVGVPAGDGIIAACAQCHEEQATQLRASVHGKLSTSGKGRVAECTSCHNAHGIVAARSAASPVSPLKVVATCARCHSDAAYMRSYNPSLPVDQLDKYRTSVHGERNSKGDPRPAECASCHGSHNTLSSNDVKSSVYPTNIPATCGKCHGDADYMKGYGIPTDQLEKYTRSVHGVALLKKNDLGAPACNRCHGNHGATPPGVTSISKVCGTCHALNADLFSSSPHKTAFDRQGLPECETCHGKHEIIAASEQLLGAGTGAVCSRCHTASQLPAGFRAATAMRSLADSLERGEQSARRLVEEAEQKGMEIGEAKYTLRGARQARLESRTMVHAFDETKFRAVIDKGLATAGLVDREARQALDEYLFRRVGLGLATLIMTVLAVALYLFVRRLERAGKPPAGKPGTA
jgi:predicted CXXCH cytochrome family protein